MSSTDLITSNPQHVIRL